MKELTRKIFSEGGFVLEEASAADFYSNKEQEYFLTAFYTSNDIINFFDNEKTEAIITQFSNLQNSFKTAKKNTSLLIFIESNDLRNDYTELRNQIFRIEEDEYYFRKYTILYTKEMIKPWAEQYNVLIKLQQTINSIDTDKFRLDHFDNDQHYLAIQLFIKFPWLKLETQQEDFQLIEATLDASIVTAKLKALDSAFDADELTADATLIDVEKLIIDETENAKFDQLLNIFEEVVAK